MDWRDRIGIVAAILIGNTELGKLKKGVVSGNEAFLVQEIVRLMEMDRAEKSEGRTFRALFGLAEKAPVKWQTIARLHAVTLSCYAALEAAKQIPGSVIKKAVRRAVEEITEYMSRKDKSDELLEGVFAAPHLFYYMKTTGAFEYVERAVGAYLFLYLEEMKEHYPDLFLWFVEESCERKVFYIFETLSEDGAAKAVELLVKNLGRRLPEGLLRGIFLSRPDLLLFAEDKTGKTGQILKRLFDEETFALWLRGKLVVDPLKVETAYRTAQFFEVSGQFRKVFKKVVRSALKTLADQNSSKLFLTLGVAAEVLGREFAIQAAEDLSDADTCVVRILDRIAGRKEKN